MPTALEQQAERREQPLSPFERFNQENARRLAYFKTIEPKLRTKFAAFNPMSFYKWRTNADQFGQEVAKKVGVSQYADIAHLNLFQLGQKRDESFNFLHDAGLEHFIREYCLVELETTFNTFISVKNANYSGGGFGVSLEKSGKEFEAIVRNKDRAELETQSMDFIRQTVLKNPEEPQMFVNISPPGPISSGYGGAINLRLEQLFGRKFVDKLDLPELNHSFVFVQWTTPVYDTKTGELLGVNLEAWQLRTWLNNNQLRRLHQKLATAMGQEVPVYSSKMRSDNELISKPLHSLLDDFEDYENSYAFLKSIIFDPTFTEQWPFAYQPEFQESFEFDELRVFLDSYKRVTQQLYFQLDEALLHGKPKKDIQKIIDDIDYMSSLTKDGINKYLENQGFEHSIKGEMISAYALLFLSKIPDIIKNPGFLLNWLAEITAEKRDLDAREHAWELEHVFLTKDTDNPASARGLVAVGRSFMSGGQCGITAFAQAFDKLQINNPNIQSASVSTLTSSYETQLNLEQSEQELEKLLAYKQFNHGWHTSVDEHPERMQDGSWLITADQTYICDPSFFENGVYAGRITDSGEAQMCGKPLSEQPADATGFVYTMPQYRARVAALREVVAKKQQQQIANAINASALSEAEKQASLDEIPELIALLSQALLAQTLDNFINNTTRISVSPLVEAETTVENSESISVADEETADGPAILPAAILQTILEAENPVLAIRDLIAILQNKGEVLENVEQKNEFDHVKKPVLQENAISQPSFTEPAFVYAL